MNTIPNQESNREIPPLAVIVTVRNEAANIAKLVDGLLAQSHAPAEVVIVDGASTDGTLAKLKHYADRGQIRLISQPCNIAQGRNIGIARASQPLIAVTDAGCLIDPDWLRELGRCFAANPDVDVISGNYKFDIHTPFEEAVVLATDHPERETSDQARYYPSSRSVAFRKSAWDAAKGYPEWLYAAEDTLFNIRLRELGFNFAFCHKAIVRWRPRATIRSMMRQFFNYARGNGRVGIGTSGYLTNLQNQGIGLIFLLLGLWQWPLAVAGAGILALHIRRHLWPQACVAAVRSSSSSMRWRVVAIMELVRIVGMAGFLAGRYDRWRDPRFIQAQTDWMGVASLDDVPPPNKRDA